MQKTSIINCFEVLLVIYILMMPILRYYDLPGGQNFYLLLADIFAIIILFSKRKIIVNLKFVLGVGIFLLWTMIISTTAYCLSEYRYDIQSASVNNYIGFVNTIILMLICYLGAVNYELFIKIYKYICYVLIAFLFIQILFMNFGIMLNGRLPYLDLLDNYYIRRNLFGIYKAGPYIRYSSLFIEPAHLAQYLAPFLCMLLYGYKSIVKKSVVLALVVTIGMCLSISGTGIAITLIIWFVYIIQNGIISRKNVIYIVCITIALLIISVSVLQLPGVQDMIVGFSDLEASDGKVGFRVIRGFLIFLELPLFYKIFGIGHHCISAATHYFRIEAGYKVSTSNKEYVNDISSILLAFGLIGFSMVVILLIKLFKTKNKLEILVYITCLSIMLSEATIGNIFLFLINTCIATYKCNDKEVGRNLNANR